jgi:phospholipase C
VPLLVISPYSKENFVSDTTMSHLSLLHFIEYNWGLPALDDLVAQSNMPLGFFNFSQTPRAPIILSAPDIYPIPSPSPSNDSRLDISVAYDLIAIVAATVVLGVLSRRTRRLSSIGPGNGEPRTGRLQLLLPERPTGISTKME